MESFDEPARVWKGNLDFKSFEDCNPFAMLNVPSGHAIYEHDADYLVVKNNFVSGAQGSALFMNSDANPGRIVNG